MNNPERNIHRPVEKQRQRSGLDSDYRLIIFETLNEEGVPPRDGKIIDPYNKAFVSQFARCSRNKDNIHLHGKAFNVPRPADKVCEEKYDADYAICLYHDIEQVGLELAHMLISRRNQYNHIFVVTQQWNSEADRIKQGLSALTRNHYNRGGTIHMPFPESPKNTDESDETFSAESAGLISFWHILDIRDLDKRDEMLSQMI